ncbi:MAG TPA: hypothetical protein DCL29_06885 [Eubacterium sp.]|nr:hypothetical protein [Eubacterium sp.]
MALQKQDLITLAKTVAKADPHAAVAYSFNDKKFSYSELDDTLRAELKEIAGTYALYRENKNILFELIEQVIDEVLPQRVLEQYGSFADIRTFAQGDKPIFSVKASQASKARAKKFVTKVGLAGVYEVFKLDGYTLEVPTEAWGGAAQIGFEEYLDGRIDMADVVEIINDGLNDCVYREIAKALKSCVAQIAKTNKASDNQFVQSKMDNLLQIADAYGKATIYCTFEFAATMVPDNNWISNEQKNAMWNTGYLANYKGHNVIILPNSFEDTNNTIKVMDPSYAYIIPTGADKPIKVAFEGDAAVREWENKDWSREIQTYKKFGIGIVGLNAGICVYQNTALTNGIDPNKTLVKNAAPGLDPVFN